MDLKDVLALLTLIGAIVGLMYRYHIGMIRHYSGQAKANARFTNAQASTLEMDVLGKLEAQLSVAVTEIGVLRTHLNIVEAQVRTLERLLEECRVAREEHLKHYHNTEEQKLDI